MLIVKVSYLCTTNFIWTTFPFSSNCSKNSLDNYIKLLKKVPLVTSRHPVLIEKRGVFRTSQVRLPSEYETSILRVMLKQYRSPIGPNKFKSATIILVYFFIGKKSPENFFLTRGITHEKVGRPWRKSNWICNSSYGSFLSTFVQIYESIAEKSPENEFCTKGYNSDMKKEVNGDESQT